MEDFQESYDLPLTAIDKIRKKAFHKPDKATYDIHTWQLPPARYHLCQEDNADMSVY